MISVSLLEHAVREDLNAISTRGMAVINPVKLVITNYPDDQNEMVEMENNPENPTSGTHTMPFSKEIYIERDDFMENPPKKFFRLAPDSEVRLKGAYIVKCTGVKKMQMAISRKSIAHTILKHVADSPVANGK